MRPIARAIASHGTVAACGEWPQDVLDVADWESLRRILVRDRLVGLALEAVREGLLPVDESQHAALLGMHEWSMCAVLVLDSRLVQLLDAFEEAGLESIVLKGLAVATLDYARPDLRAYGDIDLLVRAEQLEEMLTVIARFGFERKWSAMRPGFDERFGKGATMKGKGRLEIDVHRTFVFGAFGVQIDPDELFERPREFEVGGRRALALGDAERFLHAVYNTALGNTDVKLSSLRDLVLMWPGGSDAERVVELVERWGGAVVLARTLELLRREFGDRAVPDSIVAAAAEGVVPTRAEARAIDTYVGERRSFAAQVMATLPFLDGVRDRAAFLVGAAVPTSESMRQRGSASRAAWLRRGARSLTGRSEP